MITLGGVIISDNMYLSGITESSGVVYQQKITVEGYSSTKVYPRHDGRKLTLGSDLTGGSTMGIWCKSVIDELKLLELSGIPQVLDYHGTIYSVYIVDTSNFKPLHKWQEESPTKAYTGGPTLIEA